MKYPKFIKLTFYCILQSIFLQGPDQIQTTTDEFSTKMSTSMISINRNQQANNKNNFLSRVHSSCSRRSSTRLLKSNSAQSSIDEEASSQSSSSTSSIAPYSTHGDEADSSSSEQPSHHWHNDESVVNQSINNAKCKHCLSSHRGPYLNFHLTSIEVLL